MLTVALASAMARLVRQAGLLLGVLAAAPGYAAGAATPRDHLLDRATVTIVERRTTDAEAARLQPCSRFMRSNAEARRFLATASTITGEEAHYDFYVYHCAVSGVVDGPAGRATFSIILGGTGTLSFADGTEVRLGCRRKCCASAKSACVD